MTVKMPNLTVDHDPRAYIFGAGEDVTNDETIRFDVLGMVRHIMRERGDCDFVPIVRNVQRLSEVNSWGHSFMVEVTYSKSGWRATYGVALDGHGVKSVSCYMD